MATVTTTTTTSVGGPSLGISLDRGYIWTLFGKFNLLVLVRFFIKPVFFLDTYLCVSFYDCRVSMLSALFVLLLNHGLHTYRHRDGSTLFA